MIKRTYPPRPTYRFTPRVENVIIYFEPEIPAPSIERRHLSLIVSR